MRTEYIKIIWRVDYPKLFPLTVRDVRQGIVPSLSRKVDCGNPVVTLALCPGVMVSFSPLAQGTMSLR